MAVLTRDQVSQLSVAHAAIAVLVGLLHRGGLIDASQFIGLVRPLREDPINPEVTRRVVDGLIEMVDVTAFDARPNQPRRALRLVEPAPEGAQIGELRSPDRAGEDC
jgi:hypothetical protein